MSSSAAITLGPESTTEDVLQGIDLRGKVALVTGASSGLGAETARALASRGATVLMAVRDLRKGKEVADQIRVQHEAALLEVVELDLADLKSVRRCAETVLDRWAYP